MTEDSEVQILNRVGKTRTKVSQKINHKNELYLEQGKLVIPINDNKVKEVDVESGTVEYRSSGSKTMETFRLQNGMEVQQYGNEVIVNGKEIDLPYGTYSQAKITQIDDQPYALIVEEGNSSIYIIDMDGDIIKGMPVYGAYNSKIASSNFRYLVTQADQEIIVYKW